MKRKSKVGANKVIKATTPIKEFYAKNGHFHRITYRPDEYKPFIPDKIDLKVVMCSIANIELLQFSFGADIVEKFIRKDKNILIDRAVLMPHQLLKIVNINKSIYHEIPVKEFDMILISSYMVLQAMNVVPFLIQSRIHPLKHKRKELVILGGNVAIHFRLLKDYIDLFYLGDGEKYINLLIDLRKKYPNKQEFIEAALNTEGLRDCITTGDDKLIIPAKQTNIDESLLTANDFVSKPVNKVIEVARGCKYDCYFCFLSHYKNPYREASLEAVENAIKSYKKGTSIYPFAPDEASYKHKHKLADIAHKNECKLYSYNKRFDTFTEKDIEGINSTTRVVFGLDGLSQRIRDLTNKRITLNDINNAIDIIMSHKTITLIKLNIIFSYYFETDNDWNEFEDFLVEFAQKRMIYRPEYKQIYEKGFKHDKLNEPLMLQIAPTPFIPEPGTPFEFMTAYYNQSIYKRLMDLRKKIASKYSYIKIEGINGYDSWLMEVLINRGDDRFSNVMLNWFKDMGGAPFSNQMIKNFLLYMKRDGLKYEDYLKETKNSLYSNIKFRYPENKRYEIFTKVVSQL